MFAGFFLRLGDAVTVAFAVFEFEEVGGLQAEADFSRHAAFVKELFEAFARADAHVVAAFGADLLVVVEVLRVEDFVAAVAFFP